MKMLFPTVLLLATSVVFAQEVEKDFGDLVPENHFVITQKKTSLKENADITNYEIKVSPQKEEFAYKLNSVQTPRKLLKRNANFKVTVERVDGKINRITSIDYASADGAGVQGLTSVAVGTDGKLDSFTHCYQEYKLGLFNLKKDKQQMECVTVNKDVCAYIEKNNIDEVLVEKLNNCSDLMSKIIEHQEKFEGFAGKDQSANMKAINKISGEFLPAPLPSPS